MNLFNTNLPKIVSINIIAELSISSVPCYQKISVLMMETDNNHFQTSNIVPFFFNDVLTSRPPSSLIAIYKGFLCDRHPTKPFLYTTGKTAFSPPQKYWIKFQLSWTQSSNNASIRTRSNSYLYIYLWWSEGLEGL